MTVPTRSLRASNCSTVGPWDCGERARTVTCVLTDGAGAPVSLAAGATRTLELVVVPGVDAAPGVVNTATVTTPTPEIDPSNNTDDDPTDIPLAVLVIDEALDGTLRSGDDVTYVLTVTKRDPRPPTGGSPSPTICRQGCASWAPPAAAGVRCDADGQLVTCTTDDVLAVDDRIVIEVDVEVTARLRFGLTNVATVVGGNMVDGEPVDPEILADAGSVPADTVSAVVTTGSALPFTGSNSITLGLVRRRPGAARRRVPRPPPQGHAASLIGRWVTCGMADGGRVGSRGRGSFSSRPDRPMEPEPFTFRKCCVFTRS